MKKYLILVFYDNRNLKISKSKKSEQYFRDKSKFLSVSSMNTLLAILKVTDARRDVILAGGLYYRFPWRHLPPHPPPPHFAEQNADEENRCDSEHPIYSFKSNIVHVGKGYSGCVDF